MSYFRFLNKVYMTTGPFAGLLRANFPEVEKVPELLDQRVF